MHRLKRAAVVMLLGVALAGCGGGSKPQAAPDPKSNEVREFHNALRDGDTEIVRRLISAKPYLVNARDEQGVTPLKVAQDQGNQELADLIKQKGGTE